MDQSLRFQRTRIAPTPSGFLHLGNVLSFATTALLAERTGARILLRIDDLDQARTEISYLEDIFDTLRYLQLPWQEGPAGLEDFQEHYSQFRRLQLYRSALEQLREGGHVFACTCSRTQVHQAGADGVYPGTCLRKGIPLDTPGVAWRLNTEADHQLPVRACDGKISEARLPSAMRYFVVRKKDGFPAYQLTSLVDDRHFDVDLIVRGQDLWPSTLAQLYLSSILGMTGFLNTAFYHHPLLLEDGKKMSKSAGAISLHYLREHGATPEDIYTSIGNQLGLKERIRNWRELAMQFISS